MYGSDINEYNMYTYEQIFSAKQTALIFTAHPDDCIVFFAGLISKLRQEKKDVYVVVVTNGARGSRENQISEEKLANIRIQEEANALSHLDILSDHFLCLNHKDGEVESDMTLIGEISYYIRKFKPDIVCTHEPSRIYSSSYNNEGFFVQHRDHRKIGEAVLDAVYPFSRDLAFFPEHDKDGISPHTVFDVLLTDEDSSNFHFDFSTYKEVKKASLEQHKSQFSQEIVDLILNDAKVGDIYVEKFKYIKLLW